MEQFMKKDLVSLVSAQKGDFVLDMGCGEGDNTAALAEAGYFVMGTDACARSIEKAKAKYPDLCFSNIDPKKFITDGSADVIFSSGYIHKVKKEDQSALLTNFERRISGGGELVIELCARGHMQDMHVALKTAFAEAGFEYECPFYFPKLGEYSSLIESHGFEVEYAELIKRPIVLAGADGLETWIKENIKEPFAKMDDETESGVLTNVALSCLHHMTEENKWRMDGVYLRIKARSTMPSMKKTLEAIRMSCPGFPWDIIHGEY